MHGFRRFARFNAMDSKSQNDPISVLRIRLLGELPDDIAMARDTYQRLAGEAAGIMEAKEFSAHQAACKAALGHLESLIKLLRWACEGAGAIADNEVGSEDNANDQVLPLVERARQALAGENAG